MIGWKIGPQRSIDAARMRKLTVRTEGRIVESWLALEWNPEPTGVYHYWRPLAKSSMCMVVEYDAGWNNAIRRAFCGARWMYNDSFRPDDMRSVSSHVPFFWSRDASGFIVPEFRMSSATRAWLASHPEPDPLPNDPPTKSALESLRLDLDRPVDYAVAGWTQKPATIPMLFDPRDPRGARPAGFVEETQDLPPAFLSFGIFALFFVAGGLVWILGVSLLLGDVRRWVFWIAVIVPLIAVPWWGDTMPRYIRYLNAKVGDIVSLFIDDVSRIGYMASTDPGDALLAGGERVVWRFDQSLYKETLGRFHFESPNSSPKSKEEALKMLTESLSAQVRALPPSDQTALFVRLRREKEGKLAGDGPAFLDVARAVVLDTGADSELRKAANSFLVAWGSFFNYPGGKAE